VTVQLRGEAYAREPTPAVRERIETLYRQAGWKSCKLEWKRIKDKVWLNDYDSDDITGYIIDVTLTRQEG
jgi:pyruvate dehydrogenase complex dehydrogenase (E1) component